MRIQKWPKVLLICLLSVVVSATQAQVVEYIHTDALGSPVAITNEAGQVIERMDYEPYGAVIGKDNNDRPGYAGHVMDSATGLTYMEQRYYDPLLGRFLSVDPVAAHAKPGFNFNRYWYANNNPYRFTDPDGRNGVTAFGGILQESWNALNGRGFDGAAVLGALKDGYNGEGDGFAKSAFQDASTFIPTGALLGTAGKLGLLVREASLVSKTAEGATRIGAASLRGGALGRAEIAAARSMGKQFLQNNGSRAYVVKLENGKFNVAIFGKGGYMTSLKNISEEKLLKQASKYGWLAK